MGMYLSQHEYVLDLLLEIRMLDSRSVDIPMDYHVKLDANMGELFADVGHYRWPVGKFICLTVTRSDITYAVGVISQFMSPRQPYWEVISCILRYLKGAPGKGLLYKPSQKLTVEGFSHADWAGSRSDWRFTSGYCTFVGGNLVM